MKLRIKDNSLRIRLSRTEVQHLAENGVVEASTPFADAEFRYAVHAVADIAELQARITPYSIELLVPAERVRRWPQNDEVGFRSTLPLPGKRELKLLLEKDFVCLDDTEEDQSDNYDNPNAKCIP